MIDSPHTRKEKREKIVALCENAQDIMKDILEKHKNNEVMLVLYFLNSSVYEVVLSTFGNSTTFQWSTQALLNGLSFQVLA